MNDRLRDVYKNMRHRRMPSVHREQFDTQEGIKIVTNIKQEIYYQRSVKMFWKVLPFALLIFFAIWAIIVLCTGG